MEEKDELVKDSCYDKLNQIHQRIPAHDTKIVVGVFNEKKTGREDFMPVIWKQSLHEKSNANGTRAIYFAADDDIIKSPYFPHKNIHMETWQYPDERTNYEIDHELVDGR